jgi:hypothetical protein
MNSFQAFLTARAHQEGRAQPTALVRHRALSQKPLCIVAWQLGAEPYSVGAIAIGTQASGFKLFVPGYPLDRDLLFAELVRFAEEFCSIFEGYAFESCEVVPHYGSELSVPKELPQIIVANTETIGLLGRLGRRLAYLPTTGQYPADPLLPRLGRHLMWLSEYAQLPGQQLIVSAGDLLMTHYATAMSPFETRSLAAMNAWIAPADGVHGFKAAEVAESQAVGPVPTPKDGEVVHGLMKTFNAQRAGSKDPVLVQKLAEPLRDLYRNMVDDTWTLIWKVVDRERARLEAASVLRRSREDRIAYASHMQWMTGPAEGRRKTRMTSRNAAMRLDALERAKTLLVAEEAIDDPLRMAPLLLAGKAFAGEVIDRDEKRRELIGGRNCLRPSITVRTQEPCQMPLGADVWWTQLPAGKEWLVAGVVPVGGGSDVKLILQTNRVPELGLPVIGSRACFSRFNTKPGYELYLPQQTPWTHRTAPLAVETDLDFNEPGAQTA